MEALQPYVVHFRTRTGLRDKENSVNNIDAMLYGAAGSRSIAMEA